MMNRRKALTIAGTTAMVVAAGGLAMAANLGVLGVAGAGTDSVGSLDSATLADVATTTTQPPAGVVIIDQYDIVPDPASAAAGSDGQSTLDDRDDAEGDEYEQSTQQPIAASSPAPTAASNPTVTTSRVDDDHDDYDDDESEHEYEHEYEHETEYEDD